MHIRYFAILSSAAVLAVGALVPPAALAQACDRECLIGTVAEFKARLMKGEAPPVAPGTEIRENMALTAVSGLAWKDVKTIRSSVAFADPTTGSVVSRDGVEMNDGKPGYLSTHLRVRAGKISLVEISADTARAKADYVWKLPQDLDRVLTPAQRTDRNGLEALAKRYFNSLTTHVAVKADFDDAKCNRFHSGNQITNVANNSVEGPGARTCSASVDGPRNWGPAVEQVFPVIDPERGVVFGETLLMYADQVMFVSEVFKVEGGKITSIDNIGIVKPGLNHTTGFGRPR